jgi:rod shape-determining protein MreC
MAAVSPARTNALLMGVLVFAELLLVAASARGGRAAALAAGGAGSVSRPAVGVERPLATIAADVTHFLRDIHADEGEDRRLRLQNTTLQGEVARSRELRQENERLRRLLGMREDLAPKSIGASVITSRLTDQLQTIVVDRGGDDGVRPDMAVVAWGGAVGRVVSVEKDFARVRLLSDPNSGAAGVVARSRAEGILVGRGSEPMEMRYVPKYADVVVGDRVVASGQDGVFPRGFGLGRVTVVGEPIGASKSIRVEPEIEYRSLEDVLVLLEPHGASLLAPEDAEARP